MRRNQDLVNHFYRAGGNTYAGASKAAQQRGIELARLVAEHDKPIRAEDLAKLTAPLQTNRDLVNYFYKQAKHHDYAGAKRAAGELHINLDKLTADRDAPIRAEDRAKVQGTHAPAPPPEPAPPPPPPATTTEPVEPAPLPMQVEPAPPPMQVEPAPPPMPVEPAPAPVPMPGTESLKQGQRGDKVWNLQHDLTTLGFDVGTVDGIYGPATVHALAAFAKRHGRDIDGRTADPELQAVIGAEVMTAAYFDDAIHQLTAQLRTHDPALLHAIDSEIARIKELPEDQKSVAISEGFTRLSRRFDAAAADGKLDPRVAASWHEFRDQVSHAMRDGTLLDKARVADATFHADRRDGFQDAIEAITDELRHTSPDTVLGILRAAERVAAIKDPQQQLAAFRTGYDQLNQAITNVANKLSPEALAAWQDVMGQVDLAFAHQTVGPLARFAHETYVRHLIDLIAKDRETLGDSPETITLNKELEEALKTMEERAGAGGAISFEMLMSIVPGLSKAKAQALAPHLNHAMDEARITTGAERAAFIAQTAHESGGYRTFKEYGGPTYFQRYEPVFKSAAQRTPAERDRARRAGRLGNTQRGDGPRFAGRGAIQLTGRDNYTRASKDLFGDSRLVEHPELAETPAVAFQTAAWFWNENNLNSVLGQGDTRHFKVVTQRINGGTNGWEDRLAYYTRALAAMGAKADQQPGR